MTDRQLFVAMLDRAEITWKASPSGTNPVRIVFRFDTNGTLTQVAVWE